MAKKLGRMVTYLEGALTSDSQHPDDVVLQSHVTNENHYFSTTKVAMTTKLGMMVPYLDGLLPIKFHDLWLHDLATSCHKLKLLYLPYHSAYGHKTW